MADVRRAVEILKAGGLVAFPTETVYGLGADATNPAAVGRIFAAKGRPATNPLIAHVADEATARRFAARWPETASRLARHFWPGPLTLVVPKVNSIAAEATAGKSTVGLRSPDHPLALQLLREFGGAVAAPSANRSNRVSPTTARHVSEELGQSVDLILDGGPCRVGIESTVLDLSGAVPTLLRPGGVTRGQIEELIGPIDVFAGSVGAEIAATSPGQQSVHYAPRTPAFRFMEGDRNRLSEVLKSKSLGRTALLSFGAYPYDGPIGWVRPLSDSPADYARELYAALREADDSGADAILVEMPPDTPAWAAVRDRLARGTRPLP